jgi:hypothetical protein
MPLFVGNTVGGPMAGQELISRRPRGVLLVDKPARRCWLYDWQDPSGQFVCRETGGRADDIAWRWRVADEGEYDVVAAPWVGV